MIFARLFGFNAVITSGILFSADATPEVFRSVVEELVVLGRTKGWMRESAWWAIVCALRGLLDSQVDWKQQAMEVVAEQVVEEREWTQEKLAIVLFLESNSSVRNPS